MSNTPKQRDTAFSHMQQRLRDAALVQKALEKSTIDQPEEDEENYGVPTEITTRIEVHVLLGSGGPQDGYKIFFSSQRDKDWIEGYYYYMTPSSFDDFKLTNEQVQLVVNLYNLESYIL